MLVTVWSRLMKQKKVKSEGIFHDIDNSVSTNRSIRPICNYWIGINTLISADPGRATPSLGCFHVYLLIISSPIFFYLGCLPVPLDICTLHWFPCEAERHSINGELFRQSSLCLFIDMSCFSEGKRQTCQKMISWVSPFKYEMPGNSEGCSSSFRDILHKVEGCNTWRFSDSFSVVACLLERL